MDGMQNRVAMGSETSNADHSSVRLRETNRKGGQIVNQLREANRDPSQFVVWPRN